MYRVILFKHFKSKDECERFIDKNVTSNDDYGSIEDMNSRFYAIRESDPLSPKIPLGTCSDINEAFNKFLKMMGWRVTEASNG